jgi:hypothetical protein
MACAHRCQLAQCDSHQVDSLLMSPCPEMVAVPSTPYSRAFFVRSSAVAGSVMSISASNAAGGYHGVPERVARPIFATYSAHDFALHDVFHRAL